MTCKTSASLVRHRLLLALGVLVCVGATLVEAAQPATSPDALAAVSFLLGRWEGTAEGQPGKGTVRRDYERVLDGRFIRVRNRTEYPARAANTKGEVHEDEGFLSADRTRKRLVLRQFHVEGFVNQYVQDDSGTPERLVFTSEAIENIAAGWRARETYVVRGPDAFEEIFELAEPNQPFEVYSRSQFHRVK